MKKLNLRIALAQINPRLGDFKFNFEKIVSFIKRAEQRRCDLVLFPEAALFGYHPVDLLERGSIVNEQLGYLKKLSKEIPKGMAVLVGAIVPNESGKGKAFWNAAVLLERGKKPRAFPKQLLPAYDVFDESRHIQPGDAAKNIFSFKGRKILMTICEDIWAWPSQRGPNYMRYGDNPIKKVRRGSVDLILNMSASPFTSNKLKDRRRVVTETTRHLKAPLVYVNMVGAQDELIFDGGSFAMNAKGKIIAQCVRFQEDINVLDLGTEDASILEVTKEPIETIHQALVLGLRDFVSKTGFTKVHLGLSGGIDSAVVACLAADAVGPLNVTGIGLQGPFTSPESVLWAEKLAKTLGITWYDMSIRKLYEDSIKEFERTFGSREFGLTNENMQSRLRALMLMAYSNREKSLLLGTSNKTELALGYSTLYGDLAAGLIPIGDLLKTEVYELARHYNREGEVIPNGILSRPASAELSPGQKTEEALMPFEKLDPIVQDLVVDMKSPRGPTEEKILKMLFASEFKRWQAAPVLKVSDHAFGVGRRLPIAHHAFA